MRSVSIFYNFFSYTLKVIYPLFNQDYLNHLDNMDTFVKKPTAVDINKVFDIKGKLFRY